jgi:hypothetical protein
MSELIPNDDNSLTPVPGIKVSVDFDEKKFGLFQKFFAAVGSVVAFAILIAGLYTFRSQGTLIDACFFLTLFFGVLWFAHKEKRK